MTKATTGASPRTEMAPAQAGTHGRAGVLNAIFYKVPLCFDIERLRDDARRVLDHVEWLPHDEWHAIALHAVNGDARNLRNKRGAFAETPLLRHCPYFREVMESFRCPKQRVRLFRLEPGGSVTRHIDSTDMTYHFGTVRFHIPIHTNPGVETWIDGEVVRMQPGETWYIDTSFFPHGVVNGGTTDRVHLVVDCRLNDWIRRLVPSTFGSPRWSRPLRYHFKRIRFAMRQKSLAQSVYEECAGGARLLWKHPDEFALRAASVIGWWRFRG